MPERSIEPGYLISETGPNRYKVYKLDLSSPSEDGTINVIKTHVVQSGCCDCEGFKHRLRCRHVDMIRDRPKSVSRAQARAAAVEIIQAWEWRFDRISFDDYVFEDDSEDAVKEVRLLARGKPIMFDGRFHSKLTGVAKNGTHVILEVEP